MSLSTCSPWVRATTREAFPSARYNTFSEVMSTMSEGIFESLDKKSVSFGSGLDFVELGVLNGSPGELLTIEEITCFRFRLKETRLRGNRFLSCGSSASLLDADSSSEEGLLDELSADAVTGESIPESCPPVGLEDLSVASFD